MSCFAFSLTVIGYLLDDVCWMLFDSSTYDSMRQFDWSKFDTCFNLGVMLAFFLQTIGDTLCSPVLMGSMLDFRFRRREEFL